MQLTDQALLDGVRKGDISSFELVFKTYAAELVRYATTILKDEDEAEDVVQQLFVGIWNKKETLNVHSSLKSYLYKAVYNSSLNKIKQANVKESYVQHASYVSETHAHDAAQQMSVKEVSMEIEKAINDLPEQCRLIFKMSRFEQLKYQQIADQLNLSVKTVENQMGKALKHMRERLRTYVSVIIFLLNLLIQH